jgi:hypothetical protein
MSNTETAQKAAGVCLPRMFSCRPDALAWRRYKTFGSCRSNFVVSLRGCARQ